MRTKVQGSLLPDASEGGTLQRCAHSLSITQVRHLGPLQAQLQLGKKRSLLADDVVRHVRGPLQ
jgi:hypothetical protein